MGHSSVQLGEACGSKKLVMGFIPPCVRGAELETPRLQQPTLVLWDTPYCSQWLLKGSLVRLCL